MDTISEIIIVNEDYICDNASMSDTIIFMNDISEVEKEKVYQEASSTSWGKNYLISNTPLEEIDFFSTLSKFEGDEKYLCHLEVALKLRNIIEANDREITEIYIDATNDNIKNIFEVVNFIELLCLVKGKASITIYLSLKNELLEALDECSEDLDGMDFNMDAEKQEFKKILITLDDKELNIVQMLVAEEVLRRHGRKDA